MSSLERFPNEILHTIANNMTLNDALSLRLVFSSLEKNMRSHIALRHFTVLHTPFSEHGLRHLARKTRCQCSIQEIHSMTAMFSQVPLFYLDHLDSATLKRLHRDLIALSWRSSKAQAANIMQKLNQWST